MTKLTVAALQPPFTDDTAGNIHCVGELVREAAEQGRASRASAGAI